LVKKKNPKTKRNTVLYADDESCSLTYQRKSLNTVKDFDTAFRCYHVHTNWVKKCIKTICEKEINMNNVFSGQLFILKNIDCGNNKIIIVDQNCTCLKESEF